MADDTTNTAELTALNPTPELMELWQAHKKALEASDALLDEVTRTRHVYEKASTEWDVARREAEKAYAAWSRTKYADMKARGDL